MASVLTELARASTPSPTSCRVEPDPATRALARQVEAFKRAGYPTRHRTAVANAWNAASASERLRPQLIPNGQRARVESAWNALRVEGGTVLLLGNRGVGKTQLAVSLGLACAANGLLGAKDREPVQRYHVLGELFRSEKRTFGRDAVGSESPMDKATKADLLVLDEVHVRHESAWEDIELTLLFDRRYQDMRRTILIANLEETAARERLGSSIWSRIVETGVVLECDWPSFRSAGGAA